jgi:hypothetical protein
MAHATWPSVELTGRPTRNSSDAEDLKYRALSYGEPQESVFTYFRWLMNLFSSLQADFGPRLRRLN